MSVVIKGLLILVVLKLVGGAADFCLVMASGPEHSVARAGMMWAFWVVTFAAPAYYIARRAPSNPYYHVATFALVVMILLAVLMGVFFKGAMSFEVIRQMVQSVSYIVVPAIPVMWLAAYVAVRSSAALRSNNSLQARRP